MEWWLWLIIIGSILVVGVILYLLLAGGDEEEAAEKAVPPPRKVIDLDDERAIARLTEKHLMVHIGHPTYLTVKDKGEEGFAWILHEESGCEKVLTIEKIDELPPAPGAEEKPKGEKPKEEKPREEKRLRDGHEGEEKEEVGKGGDAHYWSLTGDKEGECKFAMAYAEAASAKQFDWDAIDEGITTIAFDVKVSEFVPPEEKPEKKEEPKREEGEKKPKEEEKAE